MTTRAGADRPYDVVLLGATGFAGKLTADYLARAAPADARWALAGRNADKLAAVRDSLPGSQATIDVLTADVTDDRSLRAVAEQTRVLATTVGPYIRHGDGVVAACAASGTDYLDLTGEPEFIDTSYVRHHRTAVDTGARLVHAAGFDSIPHDLGVLYTVEHLPTDVPITVRGYVRANAAFSGGTFHSAITAFSRPRQNVAAARQRKSMDAPPADRSVRAVAGRPHRDPTQHGWAIPLPTVDPQIVARSARTITRYGPEFQYSHYASLPNLAMALGAPVGVALVFGAAQIPPARRALLSRLSPGDGPSEAKRSTSWFTVTFVGTGGGERVVTRVSGGDPGYDETAKMLAESALCLAFDDLPETSGQVTTAAAMGHVLIQRLTKAGMGFEVVDR